MDKVCRRRLEELLSVATILHLRNGGQHDPALLNEDGAGQDDDFNSINTDQALMGDDEHKLKCQFLDRLSEIFSQMKGGSHVACAVMREQVADEAVDIWIARNCARDQDDPFDDQDRTFRDELQVALRFWSQTRPSKAKVTVDRL